MSTRLSFLLLSSLFVHLISNAADWPRFRGPNGSGIAPDDKPVPVEWSATKNLKWQTALPGPGSSSPIVVGDRVFVTCWSGYADSGERSGGDITALKRHLICVDRTAGKILWDRTVPAKQPEEQYGGMFAQNGYASHTPVSDGKSVFAFFGKSGVHAFDLDGKPLWQAEVGDWDDRRGWGTASSPVIHGDVLIVPAVIESQAMFGFDKNTGKQLWKAPSEGFASTWGSPVVAGTDLVIAVPGEVWGFNPESGKLRWYAQGLQSDSVCNSVVTDGTTVFAMGERGGGSVAIKAGGKGDVSATHTLWTGSNGSRIATPVLWEGRLYWISSSLAVCRDAKTGAEIYNERIESTGGGNTASTNRPDGNQGGFGGGGGRRGGGGDYSSPVAANGHLYQVTRRGEVLVLKLGPTFQLVARNRIEGDTSDHSSTPALSNGQIFLRSSRTLYCIGE
ncbi:PQQ-binding-like beta-propeller repeat protein [Prosthecobacter sp.]|uniref:outer membrane protein assembly factor BamB family protein n=1 Tax=Prosthecobacter sp. TaxID=1965333 RepID=UPI002ABBB53E|nr:PQQ-binding-like beta-propeller repeat protein [Prosthecobacter sp.]MDZ4403572.1 PQQ-binding-like beta-propeller repeat protein [Prosthecobacter sp.]